MLYYFIVGCSLLLFVSGCVRTVESYVEAANERGIVGCHCLELMGSAGFGVNASGKVNSMIATGGSTVESCKEIVSCN